MRLAVLSLQLIELTLFLLVLFSDVFEMVLDAEKLPLLLFELAGVVVYFSLEGLQLSLSGVHACDRFVHGGIGFEACVHTILVLFSIDCLNIQSLHKL